MAEQEKRPQQVRYRVMGKCFVNGSYWDPDEPRWRGKPVYVIAAEGLAGPALELAPEEPPPPPGGDGDPPPA